jgi:tetratricopeptide (TPR) repeat protein
VKVSPQIARAGLLSNDALNCGLVCVAVVLVYGGIATHDFVHYDDPIHIYANPLLSPLNASHLRSLWTQPFANLYIPVSYMFFGLLKMLADRGHPITALTDTGAVIDPRVFHVASILLHGICASQVYILLRRLVRNPTAALAGALLWAVHPLQLESVAWASELRGLLCSAFSLGALLLLVPESGADGIAAELSVQRIIAADIVAVVAMLCKPSAIALPLIAAAIELLALHRPWRQVLLRNGVMLALLAPFVLITTGAQSDLCPGPFPKPAFILRPFIALDCIGFYLCKLVDPLPLLVDYQRTPQRVLAHADYAFNAAIALIATAIGLAARRRFPPVATALVVFVAALLPVLGFAPFIFQYYSSVADRYAYVSLLGIAYLVAALLAVAPNRMVFAAVGLIVVALGVMTHGQAPIWQDQRTLFAHELFFRPDEITGLLEAGDEFRLAGDWDRAIAVDRTLSGLYPGDYRGYEQAGAVDIDAGRPVDAVRWLAVAEHLRPMRSDIHYDMGEAYHEMGDSAAALTEYAAAQRLNPSDGAVPTEIAKMLDEQGRDGPALQELRIAARCALPDPETFTEMGLILAREGRTQQAADAFAAALRLDPSNGLIAYDLGRLQERLGQIAAARQSFAYCVRYLPQFAPAHAALAAIER